jgi:hypothetical protein
MKALPAMQALLLDVADFDLEIARGQQEVARLLQGQHIALLRDELVVVNEEYLALRNAEENLEQEIRKVSVDLESVEKRIAHDQVLLNASASTKDIDGIEHELRSLHQRKSDLEDTELGLLEELDAVKASRIGSEAKKTNAAAALNDQESSVEALLVKARSSLSLSQQQRAAKVALLPAELSAVYERLASRGVAAARLSARDCGACRIALTAAAYDDVVATPADEIATCPNCQAILIRQ